MNLPTYKNIFYFFNLFSFLSHVVQTIYKADLNFSRQLPSAAAHF